VTYVPPQAAPTPTTERVAESKSRAKTLGDEYLKSTRERMQQRKEMAALNDRLAALHEELDELCTAPFCMNIKYEMDKDPSTWEWPGGIQPPSDADIKKLIGQLPALDLTPPSTAAKTAAPSAYLEGVRERLSRVQTMSNELAALKHSVPDIRVDADVDLDPTLVP